MATVGAKNQPLVQTTDTFNPVSDINTLSNWVASNYANYKVLSGATLHTAVTGADLFAGLVVYETSTNQFWRYDGTSWYLEPIGSTPRIQLDRSSTGTGWFTSNGSTTTVVSGWSATQNRGGFTEASGTVTVPVAGRYNIWGFFGFAGNATGTRIYQITIGGSQTGIFRNVTAAPGSLAALSNVNVTGIRLNANDTVKLEGLQNSGSTLDLFYQAGYGPRLVIEYVGS